MSKRKRLPRWKLKWLRTKGLYKESKPKQSEHLPRLNVHPVQPPRKRAPVRTFVIVPTDEGIPTVDVWERIWDSIRPRP